MNNDREIVHALTQRVNAMELAIKQKQSEIDQLKRQLRQMRSLTKKAQDTLDAAVPAVKKHEPNS